MQLGMVGLGRMGANMARRLIKGGHEIVGYAADPAGVWLTQGGNSRIRVADCGGALCGTIIWLKEPNAG